jgi:polar amino acid transport system ATP-binding protein
MRSIVKAVSLNKYYDQFHALKDINIEVEQGEVLCIIGPSGSGKSTLLRCVNQLEKIDKGGLWVDGELVGYRIVGNKLHELNETQIARQRLSTGMVFQRFNLFPHMTVLQNIIEGPCQVLRRSPKEAHEEAVSCWPASAWLTNATATRSSFRVVSNNAWPLPGPWPCAPS